MKTTTVHLLIAESEHIEIAAYVDGALRYFCNGDWEDLSEGGWENLLDVVPKVASLVADASSDGPVTLEVLRKCDDVWLTTYSLTEPSDEGIGWSTSDLEAERAEYPQVAGFTAFGWDGKRHDL